MITAPEDMIETPTKAMDALSDVLRVAQLSGGVFLHAEFTAPWCLAARMSPELCAPMLGPTVHLVPYHYVVQGELRIALERGDPFTVCEGEMVLFPGNDLHYMGSDLALRATNVKDILGALQGDAPHRLRHGGGGAATRMICGYLGCTSGRDNPIFAALPSYITIKVEQGGPTAWFRSMFEYAAGDFFVGHPGSPAVLAKLSELLFVEAIRRYAKERPAGETGWLAGLHDKVVARALALMHGGLARNWNVDE